MAMGKELPFVGEDSYHIAFGRIPHYLGDGTGEHPRMESLE